MFNENEMLFMRTNTAGTKEDSENRSLTLEKDHFEFEVELSSQDGHDQQNDLTHGGLETEDTKVMGSNVEGGVGPTHKKLVLIISCQGIRLRGT